MVGPIATKFGTVMHTDALDPFAPNVTEFSKCKMAAAAILKNPTRPEVVLAARRW